MRAYSVFVVLLGLLAGSARAKDVTVDWAIHNANRIRQVVTNTGELWRDGSSYPGLIYSEFPPNSNEEHIGEAGIWVGAIVEGDTLVSIASSWGSGNEYYPTPASWDTIATALPGDTLPLPYAIPYPTGERYVPGEDEGYTAYSDQDLIARYIDYGQASLQRNSDHTPLFLDVVQVSYAWSSPPLHELIFYNYHIIPQRVDLEQAYIAFWVDGNVGSRPESGFCFALDDYSEFYLEDKLAVSLDAEGGCDGSTYSPLGFRVYPPEEVDPETLEWTFNWYPGQGLGGPPSQDQESYEQMSSGEIMENQASAIGAQHLVAFGPVSVAVGDTLTFRVAEAMGEGFDGMYENVQAADPIVKNGFRVPSAPPPPPVSVDVRSGAVTLSWEPGPGETNPETYDDPFRADSVEQPFEGYRIYKSTQSSTGPWVLLAQYDLADDQFGPNSGLEHTYTDQNLLNSFEYFYSVTAYSKPDSVTNFPPQESSINANAVHVVPGPEPPETVEQVAVVPNPYRGDIQYSSYNPPWEKPPRGRHWMEQDRRLQFINLPERCEIRIYTLSGTLVETLQHSSSTRGYESWNLTSSVGQAVASGIYLYAVENLATGNIQLGKFTVIK